jgi:hypothetical protein
VSREGGPTPARSLAARTYLLRSPRRVLPVALVQALVTALLVAVITPTNLFERTAETYIQPLEHFTIVTPQLTNAFDEDLVARLDANPHQEKRLQAKMLWIDTPSILGELSSPLLALKTADQEELLERMGLRLDRGQLPRPGSPGATLHGDILRARGLEIGDEFGRIVNRDDRTPGRFEVVGVLEGGPRVGILDFGYASIPDFVLARQPAFQVIYARAGEKAESDRYLRDEKNDAGNEVFRVVDEAWARALMRRNLKSLPLFIGFITGAVAVIVALVTALLNVIAFQARTDEFALYLAVGHRRGRLVRKLLLETTATALLGWVVGLAVGVAVVATWDALVLAPKALVMDVIDPRPFLYSLMVPVLSAAVSTVAVAVKLHRMDPVTVIQRRGT